MSSGLPPFGIIEGYFGQAWSWAERTRVMRTLAPHGYRRFVYAPKADARLRRSWDTPHDEDMTAALTAFAAACRAEGVAFGVGLSPFELHLDWNKAARTRLRDRVATLTALGIERLALLFDDMRGDISELADIQADIAVQAAGAAGVPLTVCPSYYSDDPVLDRVFGARPADYLTRLGAALPANVEIYWTGPEVCSAEYGAGHLERVAKALGRAPTLWDNYPVNDGPRMSNHLHLRGFTGRGACPERVAAHEINPALQPNLSLLPALTLAALYREGERYDYLRATHEAARSLYPDDLADALTGSILQLQDAGHDRIDRAVLSDRFAAFDHPAAQEVMRYLEGAYMTTAAEVQTQ
ncbi:MAG: beta-N-acetylglucosaminidase domain-containing protein [Pseudomonadota bacterium]